MLDSCQEFQQTERLLPSCCKLLTVAEELLHLDLPGISFCDTVSTIGPEDNTESVSPIRKQSCETLLSFASSIVFLRSRHDRVALSPRVLKHSCGSARPIY